jgi:predicted DNA-binding protein (MmcQ/YjbR family)
MVRASPIWRRWTAAGLTANRRAVQVDAFRDYCLKKAGVTESSPFGPEHVVFKVGEKMFALVTLDEVPATANLKCDPDWALELRDRYEDVTAGYHMNKKHWNTVVISGGGIPDPEVRKMIDHSYELVFHALPKKQRESIAAAG